MSKRTPEERWQEHVAELFALMVASKEFEGLRRRAMQLLGLRRPIKESEWSAFIEEAADLPRYAEFTVESEELGRLFGLNGMTVRAACLVRDYKLDQTLFVAESGWPRVSLVTDVADPDFVLTLTQTGQRNRLACGDCNPRRQAH